MAVQLLQEDDFSECSLGVCGVLESIKVLLQCNNVFSLLINSFPHNTIRSLAYIEVSYHSIEN